MKTFKRIILLMIVVSALFFTFSLVSNAATYDDLTYSVSGGTVKITDCKESAVSVIIPEEINGYPVTSISDNAFRNCTKLTSITIPDKVTSVGCGAFYNCKSLTSVTIGRNVTSIGEDAFFECTGLTSITIPDNVTYIGKYAFYYCTSLTQINWNARRVDDFGRANYVFADAGLYGDGINVIFGDKVEKIPAYTFCPYPSSNYTPKIVSVTIGENITSIGDSAFYNCTGLTSVTIGENVTSIGDSAFYNCTGLTSVTIGENVTSIGEYAFYECARLKSITIPDNVTYIGHKAFYNCVGLTSVTIGENVISIGEYAFRGCTGLTQINWNAKNVESFSSENQVFSYAGENSDGINVVFGDKVEKIPAYAFCPYNDSSSYAANIVSITLGKNVTSIGNSAFENCSSLTSIIMFDSLNRIGYQAFYNCTDLTSITMPENVISIGKEAFYGCTNLTQINWNAKSVDDFSWSNYVFYCAGQNSDGINVVFGENVEKIPAYVFYPNSYLVNAPKIVSINMGDNVESIGSNAFYYCEDITSITIPEKVTSIGKGAFYYCTGLTQINWNAKSVDDFGSETRVFGDAGRNSDGINIVFGDKVEKIPAYLFYPYSSTSNGSKLVSVTIGKNVTRIGDCAFRECKKLSSITILENVTHIGKDAFYGIDNLTIYGATGSITENYAISNGHEFVSLRHIDECIITYDANGGDYAPETEIKQRNKNIKLTTEKPIRIGHKFLGWSTDKKAKVPEYKSGATVKFDGDVDLYAVWQEALISVTKVALNTSKLSLIVGDTTTLSATVSPLDANYQYVTWSSSNENIAIVDENGVVTALNVGSAKITATSYNNKKATCTVTVGVPADTVTFTALKSSSLAVGKTLTLSAKASRNDKVKPISAEVSYEIVEGNEFAAIDAKGKIKGVATGIVIVRATAVSGTETAFAEITINVCIPATKVTLNMTKASMIVGGSDLYLDATMTPFGNTDILSWSVDKPEIATVDENGVVTAHNIGNVKVTATSGSGKKATCSITVGEPATKVVFSTIRSTSLAVGKTLTLSAKATRDDKIKPVSTAVVYEIVEGDGLAAIDAKGRIEGFATGFVTVRATAVVGTETAFADITINVCIPAAKVTLNTTKASMAVGNELQLEVTTAPYNNTDTLTWSSSNENVAIVNEDGVVTALKSGSAKITAKTGSGKSATCTLTIGAPADTATFTALKSSSLAVGKTLTLSAKASCSDKSKPVSTNVVYEIIEGTDRAEIDAKGKLKGIATGFVTVRATAVVGTETAFADITINVCIPATKVTLNTTKASMAVGDELQLEVTTTPYNNTDTLTWSVDKPTIATVDENGVVTAHSKGKVKVTVKTGSGKRAYCTVTVAE